MTWDVFDRYAEKYDKWFDLNPFVFKSELIALKKVLPKDGIGTEIGVGTGRFASSLNIKIGIDPSLSMLSIAKERGISVVRALSEDLPFSDSSIDFLLMNTVLCYVNDPTRSIKEAKRVLKLHGRLIIGMIDGDSFLGRLYRSKDSVFYKDATFYPVSDILSWLKALSFGDIKIFQTMFRKPSDIKGVEPVKEGYGKGGFVVISSKRML